MSLMMQNSTDTHCVPCSPCLRQPSTFQSPIQFVPDSGRGCGNEQFYSLQKDRRLSEQNQHRRGELSYTQRRREVSTPLLRVAPSTPAASVPTNTPVPRHISNTPSAEQLVPLCSPYTSPFPEPQSSTGNQTETPYPPGFGNINISKRQLRAPPKLTCQINSLDLFSGDIFA